MLSPAGIGHGFETTRTLFPAKDLVFRMSLLLLPPHQTVSPASPWLEIVPGKYRASSPSVLLWRDGNDDKLATGFVELEVFQP